MQEMLDETDYEDGYVPTAEDLKFTKKELLLRIYELERLNIQYLKEIREIKCQNMM